MIVSICFWLLVIDSMMINGCFVVNIDTPSVIEISPVLQDNGEYPPNLNCTYTITEFMPNGIVYEFTKMDLEVDDWIWPCSSDAITDDNDWVAILDGKGNEVTRRCDDNLPSLKYRTPPGPGMIWFHTDNWFTGSGFTLRITADPDTITCSTTSVMKEAKGTLSSHVTISNKYRANEDCKWEIMAPRHFDTIRITFTRVAIQGQCSGHDATCTCDNDWIALYDGDSEKAPLITKRCGFTAPFEPAYFTSQSKNPTALIWFKTDAMEEYPGWELTYEGCTAPCDGYQWPNSNSLVAFRPLDSKHKLEDVSQHKLQCTKQCHGVLDDNDSDGPFGDLATSHHSIGYGRPILTIDSLIRPKGKQSFTVAFFVRSPFDGEGGLMSFINDQGSQTFAIDAVSTQEGTLRPLLQIRGGDDNGEDTYGPYDVIWPEVWTFVTVVFESTLCQLSIYGKYGELYTGAFKEKLCLSNKNTKHLRLGVTTLDGQVSSLSSASSLSCVSIYSAALSSDEISEVHEACRMAHQSAPCGAPRLALPAVPTDSFGIPAEGRFTFIASLRRSAVGMRQRHVCSATILDAYNLITAATCFAESKEPFDFSVIVGEHTLNKTENFERRHGVSRIIVPINSLNVSYSNLALLELSSPIDFTNQHVNAMCLPGESTGNDNEDGGAYVFGWGTNGRPAEISTAVPRYVAGSKTPCVPEWSAQYPEDDNICFQSGIITSVPCNGDEGSPLLAPANTIFARNSRLVPIGIFGARFGNDCSKPVPALFANFKAQRIKSQIACNVPGFTYPDNCPIGSA